MKYQLTIVAESLQELQGVIDRLEPRAGVSGSTPSPVAPKLAEPAYQQVEQAFSAPCPRPAGVVLPNPITDARLASAAPIVDDEEEEEDDTPAVFAAPAPLPNVVVQPVAAPVVPAASPTPAGAAEELDPRGFPWDERIHSSSRARLAKGNFWKNRKNLPDGFVEQVEAELRAKGYGVPQTSAPAPVATAQAPALPGTPALPVAAPVAPAANSGAVRVKELMTMGLAAGVWKAPELSKMIKAMGLEQLQDLIKYQGDFPSVIAAVELTSRLITLLTSGRVDQAWINQVLAYYTVPDVYSLTGSLDKCAAIKEYLDANGL